MKFIPLNVVPFNPSVPKRPATLTAASRPHTGRKHGPKKRTAMVSFSADIPSVLLGFLTFALPPRFREHVVISKLDCGLVRFEVDAPSHETDLLAFTVKFFNNGGLTFEGCK